VFGGEEFVVIAGPCSVESEAQIMETAEAVAAAGAKLCAAAPSSPHLSLRLSGVGGRRPEAAAQSERGDGAGHRHRIDVGRDVDLVAEYSDIIQIGARNMQNFALLKAVGRANRPIVLKRGMSSTSGNC
jgi:3-deoxy-D-arabino-heptulosonate 7-phosphate (DAHP) synthase